MLDKKIKDLINKQINEELYSAYLYFDFSNFFYNEGLDGFGNWFYIQAQEERDHAMLFVKYLQNNGEKIELKEIKAPDIVLKDIKTVLNAQLKHEEYITSLINNIYDEAHNIKDFRTVEFLNWFIKEQGEEEKNAQDLNAKYNIYGEDKKALFMMDKEFATRVYTAPSYQI